jgi:aspartyl protease family protein
MRWTGIFILFGLACAAGWFLPDADPVAPGDVVLAPSEVRVPQIAQEANTAAGYETVLERQPGGHFFADVDVNNTEIRFIVDTGASGIALTGADAEALGFSWQDDDLRVVGRGVGGDVHGKPVKLSTVQLGDLEAQNIDAVIIPRGLDVSLLGQSFLSKASSVRIENDEMVIG